MNDTPKLGKLIDGESHRDAVHIAIAPVVAGELLLPGVRVNLNANGEAVHDMNNTIGIVDPYLKGAVRKGERFWICLYPGTVTSLRHVWEHPAFDGPAALRDYLATKGANRAE